ncbi:MAG: hypothetical protein WDN72_04370 [Alphaproteobacteria bacterium]
MYTLFYSPGACSMAVRVTLQRARPEIRSDQRQGRAEQGTAAQGQYARHGADADGATASRCAKGLRSSRISARRTRG